MDDWSQGVEVAGWRCGRVFVGGSGVVKVSGMTSHAAGTSGAASGAQHK